MDLETRLNAAKSRAVKRLADQLGLATLEVKLVESHPSDFAGQPYANVSMRELVNTATDKAMEEQIARMIKVGDTVLMEIQPGVVETVVVEEIDEDTVYGLGDDGEPFCALLSNCDKVPF